MYIEFEELDYSQERKHILGETPFSGIVYEKLPDGGLNEIMMINGMYNGISREWDINGNMIKEENFFNSTYHGLVLEWFQSGELKKESIYEFGTLIRQNEWNINGDTISDYEIPRESENYKNLLRMQKKYRRPIYSDFDEFK